MKKINIVFFMYRLGGGGAARTLLNIINYINKDKFEVTLVTLNFTYNYDQFVDKDVRFVKLKTKRLRSAIFELASFLRKEKPDILFSTVITYNIVAILAKMLSFRSMKVVIREAAFLEGNSKSERYKLKLARLLYPFAHKVIALSHGVKDNLRQRYKVKENKLKVIYNPVDINHIEAEMVQPLDESILNWASKYDYTLVTAGRFVKEKDQTTLLRSFAQVRNSLHCCLILLGEGELKEQLKQEAVSLGIDQDLYFAGFQQNPYNIFHYADVFVLTSTTEGFGHVLVEALTTETLVVATKSKPGAIEVLDNGSYGTLCEIGNVAEVTSAIKTTLLQSDEKKNEQIARGKQRAHNFQANKIVEQYEQMFAVVKGVK